MAGINRTTGKATDLITFSRASGGTALRKISYGPELVTNGTFDTDLTGWTSSTYSLSLSSNALQAAYNGVTYGTFVGATGLMESGKVYQMTYEVVDASQASNFQLSSAHGSASLNKTAGIHTVTWKQVSDTTSISFYVDGIISGESVALDNISVKEVLFDQPDGTLTLFNHPTNIPRIEYDAAGNVKGLLIEEARTNLLTYSEDFTNASWAITRATLSEAAVESPNGGLGGWYLEQQSGVTAAGAVFRGAALTAANYTSSIYAKAAEKSFLAIREEHAGGYTFFNLSTGSVGTTSINHTANIEYVGNGWYRCSITFLGTTSNVNAAMFYVADVDNSLSVTDSGGIYIYGAQLEAGSFPTSYIPTSGATATRAADIASISVDNFGYNQKAGTVVVEANLSNLGNSGSGSEGIASFVANAAVENIGLFKRGGGAASEVRYEVRSSNITQASIGLVASDLNAKVSYSFAKDKFNLALDGSLGTEDTSGSVPVGVTDLSLGNIYSVSGSFVLNGHIKSIAYYPRRLSNAQLQALTA